METFGFSLSCHENEFDKETQQGRPLPQLEFTFFKPGHLKDHCQMPRSALFEVIAIGLIEPIYEQKHAKAAERI